MHFIVFRYIRCTFLALIVLALSQAAIAKQSTQDDTEKLVALLSEVKTFQASFVQFIVDKNGIIQQTSGLLKAMKPDFFFWHTDPPLEQIIVSDGTTVQVFDPDLEQVTVQKVDTAQGNSPAMLLSGNGDQIRRNYRVSLTEKGNYRFFALAPIGKESLFDSLQLKFVDQTLVEMRLRDGLGQKTTLSFTNIKTNHLLSTKDFVLELPQDIDIISEN
ncbi:MAG: outer membrane lipoprotein carrier protein LolA [Gammaproteobacteria bacterium]|nr:MAG: outer membrane lipoprotein carrier protein LolA [Gammaproteobacteria bacterium]